MILGRSIVLDKRVLSKQNAKGTQTEPVATTREAFKVTRKLLGVNVFGLGGIANYNVLCACLGKKAEINPLVRSLLRSIDCVIKKN